MSDSSEQNKKKHQADGITRRTFLKGAGLTSLGIALTQGKGILDTAEAGSGAKVLDANGTSIEVTIDGKRETLKVLPSMTLLGALRGKMKKTGTKVACGRGACGACTVIVDGKTVYSCMTLAVDTHGKSVETVEGLEQNGRLHPVQECFVEKDALQCGFCTPGMVMSCKHLLDNKSNPTIDDAREATSGNICRCGTYPKVFEAVVEAGKKMKKKGG